MVLLFKMCFHFKFGKKVYKHAVLSYSGCIHRMNPVQKLNGRKKHKVINFILFFTVFFFCIFGHFFYPDLFWYLVKLQQRVLSIVSDREKVEKESQLVRNDIDKQREALRGIKKEMKSYTVPEVYDYISQSQETELVI